MTSFRRARGRRLPLLALSAVAAAAVALPVSSASAAARPMTLVVDSFVDTPFGTAPGVFSGAKSAAKAINKAKKLNIKIVTCNNKATVPGSQACAKQAADGNAAALVGSDPFLAAGFGEDTLKAANIPFSLFGSSADEYNGKHATEFPLTGGGFSPYLGLGTVTKKAGGKKLGIVCTDFPGFDVVCENVKRVAAKQGVNVIAETSVSLTSTTFTSQVQKLKAAGADSVALLTVGSVVAPIVQAANAIGYKPKWISAYSVIGDPKVFGPFAKATGKNLWLLSALPPITAVKNYPGLKQYASQNRGIKAVNQDESSITTWAAVYGYAQIAQKYVKGDITSAKLLAAVQKAKNIKIGKGLVTWSPAKKGKAPYTRLSSDLIYYGQVKNGKYIPNPKKPIHAVPSGVTLK